VSLEDLPWIVLVILLLTGSILVSQRLVLTHGEEALLSEVGDGEVTFRQRFWETRNLDLAVQVGLIFVGTLSIATLLPRSREGDGG
jgi:hypothetical protein